MKSIKTTVVKLIAICSLAFFAAGNAIAEQGAVRISNKAMKQVITVDDNGKREISFVEPKTVIPGDIILYTIEVENTSDKSASNIVIDNPLPNNSYYRDGTAAGDNTEIQFSVDGRSYATADKLTVDVDGVTRTAGAKDYKSIRWIYTRDLQPGEKKSVSFKTEIKKAGG